MAQWRRKDRVVQTTSGELIRLGDWQGTTAYLAAFLKTFPHAKELAQYVSGQLRRVNAPAIVAFAMASLLRSCIRKAEDVVLKSSEVHRLQIMDDPSALARLDTCFRETFGAEAFEERTECYRKFLFARMQIVPDDWQRPPLLAEHNKLLVGVGSGAARMLTLRASPPGVREAHVQSILHLFLISYAILSRTFEVDFPVIQSAHTHRRSL